MQTLESRFRGICRKVEGYRQVSGFDAAYGDTHEETNRITPVNPWHRRILSELDFCLQMKVHAGTDVEAPVSAALSVLEEAVKADGVITDAACQRAEDCLLPLAEEARTYTLLMVGHAHLDMNWMWSWDETVAAVIATFRTMLRLMEEYPDFYFSQSQASTYHLVEEYAPELMPEIQKRIAEGRWEVTASAWVETDKNMPDTESLINHIVYTKRYLAEHWGVDPETLDIDFSPDTFGHSAFLPELNTRGGVKYYYHCRGLADTDKVLYRWQAPSGSEVLIYREPYWYNSGITPAPAVGLPRMAKLCGGLRTGMAVYGVGDHGGGPTRRDLNSAREMQAWPVFPALRFSTLHGYFAQAETVRDRLPVVSHELNGIFTGCYTTQSRIKKGNRRSEAALVRAEGLSALAAREWGMPYDGKVFEKAWQKTLFTHFHDILTGSCVQDSREYAMGLYQEVQAAAGQRSARVLERLAAQVDTSALAENEAPSPRSEGAGVGYGLGIPHIPTQESGTGMTRIWHIVNTTGVDRHENALLTVWDWQGDLGLMQMTDAAGNPLRFARTSGYQGYWAHRFFTVLVTVSVPAHGYTTVVLREREPDEVTCSYLYGNPGDRHHAPFRDVVLENDYVRAVLDCRSGALCSVVDKATGKECLRQGETAGACLVQTPHNIHDAWVIDRYLDVAPLSAPKKVSPFGGGMNRGVSVEYAVGDSRVTVAVSLDSEERFLRVRLHADWNEQSANKETKPLLVFRLPLAESTGRLLCDVPGGVLWRPDQEEDVPCLRYAAAECADGRAVALLADCKYGYRLSRGDLYVSLIHASHKPDPYPERGIHEINLCILPTAAEVTALSAVAETCFEPLQYVTNTAHPGTLPTEDSLLRTEGDGVIFSGVAQRDGKLAVRMAEAAGRTAAVTVTLKSAVNSACLADWLGNPLPIAVKTDGNTVCFTLPPYMQAELRAD